MKAGEPEKIELNRGDLTRISRALGVNRTHLRRVLRGERKSAKLLARYKLMRSTNFEESEPAPQRLSTKPEIHEARNPALENIEPYLFGVLSKLGISVVLVQFDAKPDSPIWATTRLEMELGAQLEKAKSGLHDSSLFHPGIQSHFFHVPGDKLGNAIAILKSGIDAHGLLGITKIFHSESAKALRLHYPPTSDEPPKHNSDDESN
jgi:hypothetical protein